MTSQTWEQTWGELVAGNARFVAGKPVAERGFTVLAEHRPRAAILACSDARVPPELAFDMTAGDLFVVRTAGHTIDTATLASLEYAAQPLGVSLIVVLGHTGCGAVAAAWQTVQGQLQPEGYLGELVRRIVSASAPGMIEADELGAAHLRSCITGLLRRSPVLNRRAGAGELGVIAAQYDLTSGLARQVS